MDHDFRKIPSPQAMKAISDEIAQKYAPERASKITEIVILPVDPYHLHAYWALDDEIMSLLSGDKGRELILRVHWLPEAEKKTETSKLWFDIPVTPLPKRKRVTLPVDATWYMAEIGLREAYHRFTSFACSNVIHVPRASMAGIPKEQGLAQTIAPARQSREIVCDEAFIDAQIKRTLAAKNPLKSHALLPAPLCKIYDEMKIDAEIRATLRAKGISLTLEKPHQETASQDEKSLSGRGLNMSRS